MMMMIIISVVVMPFVGWRLNFKMLEAIGFVPLKKLQHVEND
jgi:hypothetical protein